jgi:hypothetical protein
MTDLLKIFLGNGSVNMFQHATMGAVFSVDECYRSLLGSTTLLAAVGGGCFLCGLRHATVEPCFLTRPFRVYVTRVRLQRDETRESEERLETRLDRIGELSHRRSEFMESAVEGIRLCQEDSV